MSARIAADESNASLVAQLFEEIIAILPSGCATVQQKDQGKDRPAEVTVLPTNSGSAQFGALFFDGQLYGAFFGREPFFTTYESPWELNLRCSDGLDQQLAALKEMCAAVVAGRCEHRIRVFCVTGTIRGDKSIFRVCNIPVFHPPRLRARIAYEAYENPEKAVIR